MKQAQLVHPLDDRSSAGVVQALWDRPIPTGDARYYNGLLYLLGLLEVSGNFRVYHPTGGTAIDCIHAGALGR